MVAAHACCEGTVDSRSAGTEEDDDRQQRSVELLLGNAGVVGRNKPADKLLHQTAGFIDLVTKMNSETDHSSDDDGKNDSRHVFHQDDGTDTHGHGAAAEDHIDFFLKIICKLVADQCSDDSSDDDR